MTTKNTTHVSQGSPRLRRKKAGKQNVKYLIILILLIAFFATIGLQLILKTSLFIAELTADTATEEQDTQILMQPQILDLPDATNSARISFSGRASGDTNALVYVNDKVQDEIKVENDQFESNISLSKGENTVYIRSESSDGSVTRDSRVHVVSYLTGKPTLQIESPTHDSVVHDTQTTVQGHTDSGIRIRINNSPVSVGSDGSFSRSVRLSEGENTIVIVAEDVAGNTEEVELKVRYEKDEE